MDSFKSLMFYKGTATCRSASFSKLPYLHLGYVNFIHSFMINSCQENEKIVKVKYNLVDPYTY